MARFARSILTIVSLSAVSLALTPQFGARALAAVSSVREIIACSTTTDCLNVDNLTTGRAISGYSHGNLAIQGSTVAANGPYVVSNGLIVQQTAGIVGNDFNTDPATDNNAGVIGFSKISTGSIGYTQNSIACGCGTNVFSAGLLPAAAGIDAGPNVGFSSGITNVGVLGQSLGRAGVVGLSRTAYGTVGRTFTGTGVLGVSRGAGGVALAARSLKGGPIFRAFNATNEVASIDSNGNMILAGTLHTSSTPLMATRSASGNTVTTYGARESLPTIEDFGQAQLQYGVARVQIDPAFAQLMDQHTPYMVFLSPEGDNRGLYITNKTFGGFTVRESAGGRSSLTFSYRLVARAYGSDVRRLTIEPAAASIAPVRNTESSRHTASRFISE